ncbi:MAG: CHAP domain-containing protein [Cypionkella sp.]|nr:CHAP domain-containing protein [Cypionkella sp.]
MTTAYDLARAEIGTVEWAKGDNPKVVAYFRDARISGITDDATAWCAAFVGAMLERAGGDSTGKPNARSYLGWGTPVYLADARPGDIVVFKRGSSTWQGHVAFLSAMLARTSRCWAAIRQTPSTNATIPRQACWASAARQTRPARPRLRPPRATTPATTVLAKAHTSPACLGRTAHSAKYDAAPGFWARLIATLFGKG